MSIGLGLFLGLALLSATILFVATKDRWNWKKIAGVMALLFVGLPMAGVTAYWAWEQLPKRPSPASALWDITLGMPKREVLFRKGVPSDSNSSLMPSGHVREMWTYRQEYMPDYTIHFEEDSVWIVEASKVNYSSLPSLAGLSGYESQEDVVRKLGNPTGISTSGDGRSRILSFASRRVFVVLALNAVSGVGIYKPSGSMGTIMWTNEDTTLSR